MPRRRKNPRSRRIRLTVPFPQSETHPANRGWLSGIPAQRRNREMGLKISLLGGRHRSARFQRTDAKEGNCERVSVKSATMRFSILCRRRHYQGIARPLALRSALTTSTFAKISHLIYRAGMYCSKIHPLCLPSSVNARMQ